MADKVPVRFVKPWKGYNAGEIAGFGPKAAAGLIRDKYAVAFAERAAVTKDAPAEPAPEVKPEPEEKPKGRGKRKPKDKVDK